MRKKVIRSTVGMCLSLFVIFFVFMVAQYVYDQVIVNQKHTVQVTKQGKSQMQIYQNGTTATTETNLPTQEEVNSRLQQDFETFKGQVVQTDVRYQVPSYAAEVFEDLYVDAFEQELEHQFPGDYNEDVIETLLDRGMATIDFSMTTNKS